MQEYSCLINNIIPQLSSISIICHNTAFFTHILLHTFLLSITPISSTLSYTETSSSIPRTYGAIATFFFSARHIDEEAPAVCLAPDKVPSQRSCLSPPINEVARHYIHDGQGQCLATSCLEGRRKSTTPPPQQGVRYTSDTRGGRSQIEY